MTRRPLPHPRHLVALLALSLALVTIGSGGPVGAQGAQEARVADAGWWWRAQTPLGVGLLAPPTVQPGQLLVQGAPDGPLAVAAVRYSLPTGSRGATLTLRVADGGGPGAVVLACPPASPWFGQDAGAWEGRPEADCSSSVPGMPSDDGETWSFELDLLRTEDELDVVLVPGSVEGVEVVGSTFSVTFERPAAEDLSVSGAGDGFVAPDPGDLAEVQPSPGAPGVDPGQGAGSFDASPGGFAAPAPAPPPVPAPAAGDTAAAPGSPSTAGPSSRATGLGTEAPIVSAARTGARGLGFALLAATVGATLWSLSRPGAAAGLPGGLAGLALAGRVPTEAEPVPGGLGRFTRPRSGPPPSLR
jgi:hypothetical protein